MDEDVFPVDGGVQSPMWWEGRSSPGEKTTVGLTDPKTASLLTQDWVSIYFVM